MSPEEIIQQFQQIVATLKRVIDASATLAERVEELERRSGDTFEAQIKMNTELIETIRRLETRLAILEGHGQIM